MMRRIWGYRRDQYGGRHICLIGIELCVSGHGRLAWLWIRLLRVYWTHGQLRIAHWRII